MVKLTKQFIETELDAPAIGQRFYRDEDIKGFAVRVTPKSKSYILEKRVDGSNKRYTIGKCHQMSFEAARKEACMMIGDIARGVDPKTGQRINVLQDITLREVFQKFIEIKPIRRATQRNYQSTINRHFHDWLDLPITSITKDMVEQRHQELTVGPNRLGTPGHGRANNALKKLSALINFAADRFGTESEPLIRTNPVLRLSRNRSWHRIHPRQDIIPDHKLTIGYGAICSLPQEVIRDFLIVLLLTGLRVGEAKRLTWSQVDFENGILIIPREQTKSDREHRLPLSDFLVALLKKRYLYGKNSQWVFQSSKHKNKPLGGGVGMLRRLRAKSQIHFSFHSLRRTFMSTGGKLKIPEYVLKRLANHSVANDMTGRYVVLDIELLRSYMTQITNTFLPLLGIDECKKLEWQADLSSSPTAFTQLQIPLKSTSIM